MPTFGDYDTVGEPVAITDEGGRASTVWQAKNKDGRDNNLYAVKCIAPQQRRHRPDAGSGEEPLDADRGLEFLEAVKQLKKARSEGGRCLAPIHDFGTADEGAWYVTDFYKRTLKSWIALRGVVDDPSLRHLVYSLTAGCLTLKRSCGRSHGNLKVGNVFLAGKPRAFRKMPLELIDLQPVSMIHPSRTAAGQPIADGEQVSQIAEIQDLHAIGLIILQLVEGRIVRSEHDYNYPIAHSPAWARLGKDSERWRDLCNQLLDPHLSLAEVSLESLNKEFRPSELAAKLPMILGAVGLVCVVGAVIYFVIPGSEKKFREHYDAAQNAFGSTNLIAARQEIDAALKYKPQDASATDLKTKIDQRFEDEHKQAMAMAQQELQAKNFDNALTWAKHALQLAPSDQEASALIEKIQQDQSYQTAISAAAGAIGREDYDGAFQNANEALKVRPGDITASNLVAQAQAGRVMGTYSAAFAAAQAAFGRGNFDEAIRRSNEALKARPADNDAGQLLARAQEEKRKLGAYGVALSGAQTSFDREDYDGAIQQANDALKARPGDPKAGALLVQAQDAKRKLGVYGAALGAAQSALRREDFEAAIQQANEALKARPGDAKAGEILTQAQAGDRNLKAYNAAFGAAQDALSRGDFDTAIQQANTALKLRSGDPKAGGLLAQAQDGKRQLGVYGAAVASAQTALTQGDFDGAIQHAGEALKARPGDGTAGQILTQAKDGKLKQDAYATALAAGQAALKQENFDKAVQQATEALRLRPGDQKAGELLAQAQDGKRRLGAYGTAMSAAQDAIGRRDFDGAIQQANAALQARPGDSKAGDLLSQAKDGKQKQGIYTTAMTAAQGALQKGDFDGAIQQANAALKAIPGDSNAGELLAQAQAQKGKLAAYNTAMSAARTALNRQDYPEAAKQADVALGIVSNDPDATKLKSQATDARDLQEAQVDFQNGDYDKALNICAAHKGIPGFDTLAKNSGDEQKLLADARVDTADGSYSSIDKLKGQNYSAKPPFASLINQADTERKNLDDLRKLQSAGQWPEVKQRLTGLTPQGFLRKTPFDQLSTWADTQAAAVGQEVKKLDAQFEVLLVEFNKLKPKKALSPDAQRTGVLPSALSIPEKDYYKGQVDGLIKSYTALGWINKPSGKISSKNTFGKDLIDLKDVIDVW